MTVEFLRLLALASIAIACIVAAITIANRTFEECRDSDEPGPVLAVGAVLSLAACLCGGLCVALAVLPYIR